MFSKDVKIDTVSIGSTIGCGAPNTKVVFRCVFGPDFVMAKHPETTSHKRRLNRKLPAEFPCVDSAYCRAVFLVTGNCVHSVDPSLRHKRRKRDCPDEGYGESINLQARPRDEPQQDNRQTEKPAPRVCENDRKDSKKKHGMQKFTKPDSSFLSG